MISIAAPSRCERPFMSSRIWAWIVNVERRGRLVGQDQRGLQDSDMAIINRCRMPPLNWCGYCRSRRSASDMPTSPRIQWRGRGTGPASFRDESRTDSVSWRPTVSTGLSEGHGFLEHHGDCPCP